MKKMKKLIKFDIFLCLTRNTKLPSSCPFNFRKVNAMSCIINGCLALKLWKDIEEYFGVIKNGNENICKGKRRLGKRRKSCNIQILLYFSFWNGKGVNGSAEIFTQKCLKEIDENFRYVAQFLKENSASYIKKKIRKILTTKMNWWYL